MKVEIKHPVFGKHCWKDCPFDDVKYLRIPHHHTFWYRVTSDVSHPDRALEFIMLRLEVAKQIHKLYPFEDGLYDFGGRSCEMLSSELEKVLHDRYHQPFEVSVSEDDTYRGGSF